MNALRLGLMHYLREFTLLRKSLHLGRVRLVEGLLRIHHSIDPQANDPERRVPELKMRFQIMSMHPLLQASARMMMRTPMALNLMAWTACSTWMVMLGAGQARSLLLGMHQPLRRNQLVGRRWGFKESHHKVMSWYVVQKNRDKRVTFACCRRMICPLHI